MVLFGCCFWPHFAAISVRFLPIMAILGVFTVILRFFIMFGDLECIKQICKSMQKYANSCQRKLCKIVQRHAPDKHAWSWLSLFSFFSALPVKLYNFSWIINLIQSCQATPTSICCGIEVSPDSWLSWLPETCCFELNFELHCAEIVVRLPLVPRMSILGRSNACPTVLPQQWLTLLQHWFYVGAKVVLRVFFSRFLALWRHFSKDRNWQEWRMNRTLAGS